MGIHSDKFTNTGLLCTVILMVLFGVCSAKRSYSGQERMTRHRRQLRNFYPQRRDHITGWGQWGTWSSCSRSCGGGTSLQTRTCYRGRYRDREMNSESRCPGPYKRYISCKAIACPGGVTDVRAAQCVKHNFRRYYGEFYVWEPFETGNYCQLNCRAQGQRFYVRHSLSETDGIACTPYPPPPTTTHPSRHICINGRCLSIGCDNVVNSGLTIDKCGVCGGNGASCEVVVGLFRRENLNLGYNFVVKIPALSTQINITELSRTINYIALNSSDPRGRKYINGIWGSLDPPNIYQIPGTYVNYTRPLLTEEGESMIIAGPTREDMDVWLFFQRNNPGIFYKYTTPKAQSEEKDLLPSTNTRNDHIHRPNVINPGQTHQNSFDITENSRRMDGRSGYSRQDGFRYNPYPPRNNPLLNRNVYYPQNSFRTQDNVNNRDPMNPVRPYIHAVNNDRAGSDLPNRRLPTSPVNNNPRGQDRTILPEDGGRDIDPDLGQDTGNPRREVNIVKLNPDIESLDESTRLSGRERDNQAVETVVKYRPKDQNADVSRVRWLREGFSACSKSCAEGRQTVLIKCINRETRQTISDRYCDGIPKPGLIVRKCNRAPCPAYYDVEPWSECSRTCDVGLRSRRIVCRQQYPGNFTTVVSHKRCRKLKKPNMHEPCRERECARWTIKSDWSECSVKCGGGKQSREVVCASGDRTELPNRMCAGSGPPPTTRSCKSQPCVTSWFNTDWGSCSSDCDTGVQQRDVRCINTADDTHGCDGQLEPPSTRSCTKTSCGDKYEWFTGPWGSCSSDCGNGMQNRRVTCLVIAVDGGMSIADSRDLCSSDDQPITQQSCNTQSCGSRWFYSAWSECTVTCGGGTRDRGVWCLDSEGSVSTTCKSNEKPSYQERCNTDRCNMLIDPQCKDHFPTCKMFVQARLCSYAYYGRNCCLTCSRTGGSSILLSGRAR